MTFNYKKILPRVILIALIFGFLSWIVYHLTAEKKLEIVSPAESAVLRANETFKISWKSRNISRVGIILIKGARGEDTKWIARDISARQRSYNWQVFVWEEPREDYRLAIFEYPWKEGGKISYSDGFFTILGPKFASCDNLSIAAKWPFVPSDFPNLKKVFITEKRYNGNLERLEGADEKCGQEAAEKGYGGNWKAFLGDDANFAFDRLNLEGIFVSAVSEGAIPEGKFCHRLLGNDFNDFFKKLSDPLVLNRERFEERFLNDLQNLWLGRINKESARECIILPAVDVTWRETEKSWSFTTTCQNWTTALSVVSDYPPKPGQEAEFPVCFTAAGVKTSAVGLAGLASGITGTQEAQHFTSATGKTCDTPQKLLCVQQ